MKSRSINFNFPSIPRKEAELIGEVKGFFESFEVITDKPIQLKITIGEDEILFESTSVLPGYYPVRIQPYDRDMQYFTVGVVRRYIEGDITITARGSPNTKATIIVRWQEDGNHNN